MAFNRNSSRENIKKLNANIKMKRPRYWVQQQPDSCSSATALMLIFV